MTDFKKELLTEFRREYDEVVNFKVNSDYKFPYPPSLMQKLAVFQLMANRHYANWCGTGAGKTNSALIAGRETDSRVMVIVCPNSVRQSWVDAIDAIYPDGSNVVVYEKITDIADFDRSVFNYIIVNYDKMSYENENQGTSFVNTLLEKNVVDFLCLDEVQLAKHRSDVESKRRECLKYLRMELEHRNPDAYVYGMTATPVINSLAEARSIVELITGKEYPEIGEQETINNCYQANKVLALVGFRYVPNYGINVVDEHIEVDGSGLAERLLACKRDYVAMEAILAERKLDDERVLMHLTKGTILYTQYKKDIIDKVVEVLDEKGVSFAKYTGDESVAERTRNMRRFIAGKVDVLLATSPIATGVNGLQEISDKIIILSYPWTGAEYDQLLGRINRQGSNFKSVTIVHPDVIVPMGEGKKWCYEHYRYNVIKNKKTLSDVVVDGNLENVYKFNRKRFIAEIMQSLENGTLQDHEAERNEIKIKEK